VTVKPPYTIRQQTLTRNLSGQAQEERLTIQSRVSYADLDFSKQADVDTMRDRLRKAARDNCRELESRYPRFGYIPVREAHCVRTATLQSFAQLDQIRATVR
jgi:UrcA family protein